MNMYLRWPLLVGNEAHSSRQEENLIPFDWPIPLGAIGSDRDGNLLKGPLTAPRCDCGNAQSQTTADDKHNLQRLV